jgi:hypothetical protein
MKRFALLAVLTALCFAMSPRLVGAHQATPDVKLSTPEASDCTVDPRTGEDIAALAANTGAATMEVDLNTPNPDAATPTPFVAPLGTPIIEGEAVTDITELVRHYYACQNANDTLRLFALMTDDFVARTVNAGSIDPADFDDVGTPSTDVVASEQQTIALNGIVQIEADVYGVNVVGFDGASGEEFTDYLIVVRDGERYLIDDLVKLSQ